MDNNNPLVSVLTVSYKHEKFITDCIESILNSIYINFELIIVDDVSPDNTYKVAKEYEKKDERVKVYRNEKNLGDYPNRNKAASYAKGEYIFYVDGDDIIYPHAIQVLVWSMKKYPEAAFGLVKLHTEKYPLPFSLSPEEAYEEHFLGNGLFQNAAGSGIIKRKYFEDVGRFNETLFTGDTEMWYNLAAKYPMVKIPGFLGWTRTHENQESKREKTNPEYLWKRLSIDLSFLKSNNCPLDEKKTKLAENRLKRRYIRNNILVPLKRLKIRHAYKVYRNSDITIKDIFKALK